MNMIIYKTLFIIKFKKLIKVLEIFFKLNLSLFINSINLIF